MSKDLCPSCDRVRVKDTGDSMTILFRCPACGDKEQGGSHGRLMGHTLVGAQSEVDFNEATLRSAPFDPTATKVMSACPKCALPYRTQVVTGERMQATLVCKCGHRETPS